jgi:hypothetical protein
MEHIDFTPEETMIRNDAALYGIGGTKPSPSTEAKINKLQKDLEDAIVAKVFEIRSSLSPEAAETYTRKVVNYYKGEDGMQNVATRLSSQEEADAAHAAMHAG